MGAIDDIRAERIKKRERAIALGMQPYAAYTSHEGDSIRDFLVDFEDHNFNFHKASNK